MKSVKLFIGIILIGFIMAGVSLIAVKLSGRTRIGDWTESDLYTLSEGTRNIVTKLNQPIELRLYYSRVAAMEGPSQIRYWNDYFLYVRDLLQEYERLSDGKLTLKVIDPRPYSDAEQEAMEYGLRRFQLSEDESFFFGMVARTELGKDRVIEFFEPQKEATVEYDITKTISQLVQRDKKKIGVLSSLEVLGTEMSPYMMQMLRMQGRQPQQPWVLMQELKQTYELQKIDLNAAELPTDIDYLMIIHPKEVGDEMLYAIDQFVMEGGRLLVFVDPHCLMDRPPQNPQNPMAAQNHKTSSNLNALLKKWGVRLAPNQIAVDRTLALKGQVRRDQPPETILPYMELTEEAIADDEIVTANLEAIRVVFAGQLQDVPDTGTKMRPLLQTSKVGSTWQPEGRWGLQMFDAAAVRREVVDGSQPVTLACLLTGTFKTNFPDGPPAAPEEDEADDAKAEEAETPGEESAEAPAKAEKSKKTSTGDATVIVVADVDLLTDSVAYTRAFYGHAQAGDNAPFVFNAIDYLAGSKDLIAIRTRGQFRRPFTAIDKIEEEAASATEEEIKKIKDRIDDYQEKLQKLGSSADAENIRLIQNEAMQKRRELEAEIEEANRELRGLNAQRRRKVEAVQTQITAMNLILPPLVVFLIGAVLWIVQVVRMKSYAARRS